MNRPIYCESAILAMVFLFIGILFIAGSALGYDVVSSGDGVILARYPEQAERRAAKAAGQSMRDPFNWAADAMVISRVQIERSDDGVFASLRLNGILFDEKMPLAIIDDSLVKEGEAVSGVVVKAIYRNEVVVEHEKQLHTLRFSELFSLDATANTTKK